MKHIKLFEQFISEASGNDKRIKEIQDELEEIYNDMEDIQDALDKGDIDKDEAELKQSDLDGFKMELEGELVELQNGSKVDELGAVQKLLDKFYELSVGSQSHKWAYMINNVPADQKNMMTSLQKRDQQIEESDVAKAEKLAQKIEKLSKDFSEETKSYISYYINDFISAYRKWSQVAMTLQGAQESCKEHDYNCKGVAAIKSEYSKEEAELKKVQQELATKQGAVLGK